MLMHDSKTFTLLEHLKHKDSNNLLDLFGCLNGNHQILTEHAEMSQLKRAVVY